MSKLLILAGVGLGSYWLFSRFGGSQAAAAPRQTGVYFRTITTTDGQTLELMQQGGHLIDNKGNLWT